jgi:LacI family transcriptional regulator, repressor for deo operon, udp, cdd, tsx, nupC, and nupG
MRNIGLVLVQSAPRVAYEPLISGIEHGLEEMFVKSGMSLVTRVVRDRAAELEVYRYWHATTAVDAVVLVRLRQREERIDFLKHLGIPFVAVADTLEVGDFSAVTIDSGSMMREAVSYLSSHGHADIAYVKAPEETVLSDTRTKMFINEARRIGIRGRVVSAELTEAGSHQVTTRLISDDEPRPSAIIYDDDVTAVAGLEAIKSLGLRVPDDVAVLAWNDSVQCQSATPPVTALSDQAHMIGVLAATSLMQALESGERTVLEVPDSFVVQRMSA